MSRRPEVRRRQQSIEQLAELANLPRFALRERLERIRSFDPACAVWRGSGWVLTDLAWRQLLGEDFARVLELGGFKAYNSDRRRAIKGRRSSLHAVASFYGEDL